MVNTHVITVRLFCILIVYHESWPESSKVMGMINVFVDEYKNTVAFIISATFKDIDQLFFRELKWKQQKKKKKWLYSNTGSQVKWTYTNNTSQEQTHYLTFPF